MVRPQRKSELNDKLTTELFRLFDLMRVFYYEYKPEYWFWEFIDLARRLALTSGISLMFGGTVTQITIAILVSVAFIKLNNSFKPYYYDSEDIISEMGQYQVFLTFTIAYLFREQAFGLYTDLYVLMDYILVFSNFGVIFFSLLFLYFDVKDSLDVKMQITEILQFIANPNFSNNLEKYSSHMTLK